MNTFKLSPRSLPSLLVPLLLLLLLVPASALAGETGPQWTVTSVSLPTNFRPGGDVGGDSYKVLVTNTGDAANTTVNAKHETVPIPVTITDQLPAGLTPAAGATGEDERAIANAEAGGRFGQDCGIGGAGSVSCTYGGVVPAGDVLVLSFPVTVAREPVELPESCREAGLPAGALSCVENVVRVAGGGAASAEMQTPTTISDTPAGFGVSAGGATSALSSVQAGAHPNLTVSVAFNTQASSGATSGNVKNTSYLLPAGFAGDLVDTPACQAGAFLAAACPVPTQVGVVTVLPVGVVEGPRLVPVYNLAPEPGEVAKLGFTVATEKYEGDIAVRPAGAPGEYGLQTTFYNVTAGATSLDAVSLTVWGVPAAAANDPLRKGARGYQNNLSLFGASDSAAEAAYFTNPTSCGGPLQAQFELTSWQRPHESESPPATVMGLGEMVGCDRLLMDPSLTAETTTSSAYAATGFDLDTTIPQTYPNPILATSTLKQEVVTLPEGMTVNPSSGAGLTACSEQQYAEEQAPEPTAKQKSEGHGCPNSSKLATVKIKTPSIEEEVTGSAYLAEPAPRGEAGKNPFNSLLSLYLVARAKDRGVLVKAPGLVQPNEVTGRLTTTFGATPAFAGIPASPGLPPLPASLITFSFNQGANAPLVTPSACGNYTVQAALTPWADPEANPLEPAIPPFAIFANCPAGNTPPFAPGVTAGTENNDAGSYSPLNIRLTRNDGEQEITGFASQLPPGLTGNLSGIPFCSEAQIALARSKSGAEEEAGPSCPAASEIGHSVANAGVGSILAQAPGKLYLGGPFEGAPFSIVSITSAHVGPFDLGTVVVHLPLDINPETAAVTIPAGAADQIPHIIKGIVVHIREIRVFVNRQNFMINPTSCNPFNFSATVIGGGAEPANPADNNPVTVSTPFRVTACQALKFEPKFTAGTTGKTSKANGASLHVALTYPTGALGSDANIKYVKVDLPKALPSRLTTLQRACLQKEFRANPASCPPESLIGTAKAVTPILPVPLEGPVYFVSNGEKLSRT